MSSSGCLIDLSKANLDQYQGQWVAIVNNKIIAIEKTAKDAYSKAKEKHPDKVAFVMKVPSDSVMLL